jgi:taurine transport system ATP-binding protein
MSPRPGRIVARFDLDYVQRFAQEGNAKAIKTLPGFAQLREQIRDIVHRSEHTDSAHSADSTEHAAAHAKQGALA